MFSIWRSGFFRESDDSGTKAKERGRQNFLKAFYIQVKSFMTKRPLDSLTYLPKQIIRKFYLCINNALIKVSSTHCHGQLGFPIKTILSTFVYRSWTRRLIMGGHPVPKRGRSGGAPCRSPAPCLGVSWPPPLRARRGSDHCAMLLTQEIVW